MKGVILAAGRGSRMKDETDNKPKCLAKLGGKPLIQWQIESMKEGQIEEIGIVRGYMSHMLDGYGDKHFENHRWSETNMVMSLTCAEEWLDNGTCIVSYSDIVYSADTISLLSKKEGDIVITYDKEWLKLWQKRFENPLSDAETFRIDKRGVLVEIGNRAKSLDEIEGQYMGLLKFTSRGWQQVKGYLSTLNQEECDRLDMTGLLNRLIERKIIIDTVPINEWWYEVDSEKDLKIYNSLLNERDCN
ncbi:MAG: phosphocholine cytidylyltransferase family protein [Deltaproteobacteria bacterium]|nr:phosphocholine cytidylyltransferase family protein [Deltaproteobacteria bacterium]